METKEHRVDRQDALDDRPPIFSSWHVWYAIVLSTLVVLISVFYFITTLYQR